jgi:hypothetical protein
LLKTIPQTLQPTRRIKRGWIPPHRYRGRHYTKPYRPPGRRCSTFSNRGESRWLPSPGDGVLGYTNRLGRGMEPSTPRRCATPQSLPCALFLAQLDEAPLLVPRFRITFHVAGKVGWNGALCHPVSPRLCPGWQSEGAWSGASPQSLVFDRRGMRISAWRRRASGQLSDMCQTVLSVFLLETARYLFPRTAARPRDILYHGPQHPEGCTLGTAAGFI